MPGAAYGFTQEIADAIASRQDLEDCDVGGIGGTLAGNALSLAAMRATLENVLTQDAFDRMIPLAERWTAGVATRYRKIQHALARYPPWLPRRISFFSHCSAQRNTRLTMPWISNWNVSCTCSP